MTTNHKCSKYTYLKDQSDQNIHRAIITNIKTDKSSRFHFNSRITTDIFFVLSWWYIVFGWTKDIVINNQIISITNQIINGNLYENFVKNGNHIIQKALIKETNPHIFDLYSVNLSSFHISSKVSWKNAVSVQEKNANQTCIKTVQIKNNQNHVQNIKHAVEATKKILFKINVFLCQTTSEIYQLGISIIKLNINAIVHIKANSTTLVFGKVK